MSLGPANSKVQAYYKTAYAAFRKAMENASEPETHYYRVDELVFCLQFAGSSLVPKLTPALEHLETGPVLTPDLTIGIWDGASTGITLAPPTQNPEDFISRTEIKGYMTDTIQVTYEIGSGVLNLLDVPSNTALFWTQDADQIPYYEMGAPLRSTLSTWLQSRGYQYLHAAAVGTEKGCVILAGKGGSGKSTSAINCLRAGLHYLSDDYCVAKLVPEPTVCSLYNSGKLDPDTTNRFPQFSDIIERMPHIKAEKTLFFLGHHFKDQCQRTLPLKAILLPHITSQSETRIQPLSAALGLSALAPSTIFQLPGSGKMTFNFIAELVRNVPVYRLPLNSCLDEVPRVIRTFLGTLDE